MKKVLIIYKIFSDDETTKGIHRKMLEQARSLERLGAQVDMINLHSKGIQLDGKLVVLKNLFSASSRNNFTLFDFYNSIQKIDGANTYDVYYIRYSPLTFYLLSFLKFIKKANPEAKIFLELPTYPYLAEYSGLKLMIARFIGSRRHGKLKKYINGIVSPSAHENIWGIPVKNIKNAVDVESYKLSNAIDVNGVMRFIIVCTFHNWHGVDRFINGLIAYNNSGKNKYKVYVTLVGEGPELNKIQQLCEDPQLKDTVFFYPSTYGGELNQFFDQSDLAVGTLAVDRNGLEECSALKHREYGARGIPFIYAGKDVSFDGKDFVLSLPLKEQSVDFFEVEKFFDKIKSDKNHYSPKEIRSRVAKDLSWEIQLGFILK
jgi:glycosyltransferase involved in cell wall biosynthesis